MAITRSQIVDALDANLNEMHQDGLSKWKEEYSQVFNLQNSNKQSEKDSYESGFKIMPEKAEGAPATYDVILPGISKVYTHATYAMGYEITEEAIEDNLRTQETFDKLPEALARSGIETVEVSAAAVINEGLAGTTTGFDGKALFATDHPNLGGGSQANKPAVDADLSVTSLTAGLTSVEKFTDERGLKRPMKAVMLAIPPDLWNVADELLRSEYKPYTSNREVNALQEKNLRYFQWHYMTDADAWCLFAEKGFHKLKFFWRVRPGQLKRGTDFDSTNLKHLQRMRFSVGYSHWMGTYGTNGA